MGLASRRAQAMQLRARQERIAQTRPNLFAANRIVKQLTTTQVSGLRPKTAAVVYDKRNAVAGRAIEREFARKGIKTQSLGLIGTDPNTIGRGKETLTKMAGSHVTVFLTGGKKNQFDAFSDVFTDKAEARMKTKRGTTLALNYGVEGSASMRTIAATAREAFITRQFTKKTMQAVQGSREIKVITAAGTNLTFTLSPRMKWLAEDGRITKDAWGNMPAGEVYTAPLKVNGTVVIDGFMNIIGKTGHAPIKAQIRDGKVVINSVTCANEGMRQKFIQMMQKSKNCDRVGELGLGTNVTIKKLQGNVLIDEKIPGVHIAFGDPYGEWTGAKWEQKDGEHHDAILVKPTIIVDGRPIMRQGRSLLK